MLHWLANEVQGSICVSLSSLTSSTPTPQCWIISTAIMPVFFTWCWILNSSPQAFIASTLPSEFSLGLPLLILKYSRNLSTLSSDLAGNRFMLYSGTRMETYMSKWRFISRQETVEGPLYQDTQQKTKTDNKPPLAVLWSLVLTGLCFHILEKWHLITLPGERKEMGRGDFVLLPPTMRVSN